MGALDKLYAHDAEMTAENERLRGLLSIARDGLRDAWLAIPNSQQYTGIRSRAKDALSHSDPDAPAQDVKP